MRYYWHRVGNVCIKGGGVNQHCTLCVRVRTLASPDEFFRCLMGFLRSTH